MSTLPISTIKDLVFDFVTEATGLPESQIVFAYQGGTEPKGSYISIIPILGIQRHGVYDEQVTEPNADLTIVHRRSLSMQIDCYGQEADENITAIFDALDNPLIYNEHFNGCEFSAMFSSNIRNLSAVKNIRYEQRFNVDLTIEATYTTTILADDIGWFNTIKANTTTLNPQLGEITITGA